ncbi:MAG: FliA/WhiG family RNA polymerase sigma factor [Candidatus Eisenbacteria bacterium]|nr:FliA/WhiG family RNA polymerase sigma factor [Candidatus Latescibacterota bacterium]MBD3302454.1 FliA/WhiG family RNA polymerase sigma factor [Candidatus Eisenbacteria bacterium]
MTSYTDQLWRRYATDRDEEARCALMDQYIGLVHHLAREIAAAAPSELEIDDLISAGTIGLVQAIEAFDPNRGFRFSTYAVPRIRGAILDELRSWDWVPRTVRQHGRLLDRSAAVLRTSLGREPTEEEIAANLSIEPDTHRRWIDELSRGRLASLDEGIDSDETGEVPLVETIQDARSPDPLQRLEKRDRLDTVVAAIGALPSKDQIILALLYYENLTMKQIGRILRISESRVCQIHTRAIRRVRDRLEAERKVG